MLVVRLFCPEVYLGLTHKLQRKNYTTSYDLWNGDTCTENLNVAIFKDYLQQVDNKTV